LQRKYCFQSREGQGFSLFRQQVSVHGLHYRGDEEGVVQVFARAFYVWIVELDTPIFEAGFAVQRLGICQKGMWISSRRYRKEEQGQD